MSVSQAYNYRVSAFYSRYAIESGRWSVVEADRFMHSIWTPTEHAGWPEWLEQVTACIADSLVPPASTDAVPHDKL